LCSQRRSSAARWICVSASGCSVGRSSTRFKLAAPKTQNRRAQSAMEYLLITAFAFLILAAILLVGYSQTATFSRDVTAAQLQKVGNQITDAANAVYYVGPPAKKTVRLYFPDLI